VKRRRRRTSEEIRHEQIVKGVSKVLLDAFKRALNKVFPPKERS
jgi:hypothetical protein